MLAAGKNRFTLVAQSARHKAIHTTLYDLVEAVSEAAEPAGQNLVSAVVRQLMDDCSARFDHSARHGSPRPENSKCCA